MLDILVLTYATNKENLIACLKEFNIEYSDLEKDFPDVATILDSIQAYHQPAKGASMVEHCWLQLLIHLSNKTKHAGFSIKNIDYLIDWNREHDDINSLFPVVYSDRTIFPRSFCDNKAISQVQSKLIYQQLCNKQVILLEKKQEEIIKFINYYQDSLTDKTISEDDINNKYLSLLNYLKNRVEDSSLNDQQLKSILDKVIAF